MLIPAFLLMGVLVLAKSNRGLYTAQFGGFVDDKTCAEQYKDCLRELTKNCDVIPNDDYVNGYCEKIASQCTTVIELTKKC